MLSGNQLRDNVAHVEKPQGQTTEPVALVFIFFSCGEDFLRSSLGRGWRELAICDWRLPIAD
jgi:hypothetical protein